jgi:hypothetical protein
MLFGWALLVSHIVPVGASSKTSRRSPSTSGGRPTWLRASRKPQSRRCRPNCVKHRSKASQPRFRSHGARKPPPKLTVTSSKSEPRPSHPRLYQHHRSKAENLMAASFRHVRFNPNTGHCRGPRPVREVPEAVVPPKIGPRRRLESIYSPRARAKWSLLRSRQTPVCPEEWAQRAAHCRFAVAAEVFFVHRRFVWLPSFRFHRDLRPQ